MPNESLLESDLQAAFQARVALQSEKRETIFTLMDSCKAEAFEQQTVAQLEALKARLFQTWKSFNDHHEIIAMEFPQLYTASQYYTKKMYATTIKVYGEALSIIAKRLEDLRPPPSTSSTEAPPTSSSSSYHHLFEKIKLKPFSGRYEDWTEFEDLFQASMKSYPDLSPAHKLTILKSSVQGDAARLISHLKTTNENYDIAWKLLTTRYENKRLLISTQLDKLFGNSSAVAPISKDLHDLLNTLTEALDSLKGLGAKTEEWDMPLVYHTVRRLDPTSEATTLESIELTSDVSAKLKLSSKPSSSQQSSKSPKKSTARAYAATAQSSQAPAVSAQQPQQAQPSAPRRGFSAKPSAHQSSSVKPQPWMAGYRSSDDPGHVCDYCESNEHYIAGCPAFRKLSRPDRLKIAMQYRLCSNYLGRHDVKACRSEKRCSHCGMKHHSLVHSGETNQAQSPQDPAPSAPPAQGSSSDHQLPTSSAPSEAHLLAQHLPPGSTSSPQTHLLSSHSAQQLCSSTSSTTALPTCFISAQALSSTLSSSTAHSSSSHTAPALHSSSSSPEAHSTSSSSAPEAALQLLYQPATLLATVQAQLIAPAVTHRPVRSLLDLASELNFITSKLANQLQLPRRRSGVTLTGIGNTPAGRSKGVSIITLKSLYTNDQIQVAAHILNQLTTTLPYNKFNSSSWKHLHGLQLADQQYATPGKIDIILGASAFSRIIKAEIKRGQPSDPIALNTIFGWIIFGPLPSSSPSSTSSTLHVTQDQALHDLLSRFRVQEEAAHTHSSKLTPDEEDCEKHFTETHSRDSTGRYTVRLPIIPAPPQLGESRNVAFRCLKSMLKRLSNDSQLNQLYRDFMKKYEALGHMRRVSEAQKSSGISLDLASVDRLNETTLAHDSSESGGLRVLGRGFSVQVDALPPYYLPHHGVLREHSLTTKLRVVFNGSAPTSSGSSLNDVLHSDPKLQLDIFDVLLWIRRHKVIFSTDITKMFRQINVHPADHDLQRILWLDEHDNIVPFQLTTVTYCTRPAPYLAVRVLLQLIKDEGEKYPRAIAPMTKGRYVDDIFGGSDNLEEAQLIAQDLIKLCMAGSFPLAKWASNSHAFLRALSLDSLSTAPAHSLDDTELKVLGLSWNPSSDQFVFLPKNSSPREITKRSVLSKVAQLFDPLGFLAPITVREKMFLQTLWLNKSGWDDELPHDLAQRWIGRRDELPEIAHINIPRWLNIVSSSYIELHGFSDASQLAMAACIYIKVINPGEQAQIKLLCAKTKVAPLKPVTIPRLELTAAWILAKLVKHAQQVLELAQAPVYLWTDSSVALTWILSHPSSWKEYVKNRVAAIQELNPTAKWLYVPGKQNPADCASRGISPAQLKGSRLWWNGPEWLTSSISSWPAQQFKPSALAHKEERSGTALITTEAPKEENIPLWYLVSKYSHLPRLLKITALCTRFCSILKKRENSSLAQNPVSPQELQDAQLTWVKIIQRFHFDFELKALKNGVQLPSSHFVSKLTAFTDKDGILRVGGRLKNAPLDDDEIHPMILPRHSYFSYLVIRQAHLQRLHGGVQLTLMTLRDKFWVIGGRAPVRSVILKCVTCARYRAQRAQQLMGQLPSSRVTPVRAFHTTGFDYAGPFQLKTFQGRGAKTYKDWIAVFVCFVTSAVHLEVVSDYSTDAFIKAYRRFTSRRGVCSILYSDRGTNFRGADSFLKELFAASSQENAQLVSSLAQVGTKWIYSPPSAPHFGGKWEAAVKSVKAHLVRVMKNSLFTFEDFTTLVAQIKAVLNSRPLSPLTDDPEDLRALTPAHFLHGSAIGVLPDVALDHLPESRLALWQLIQQKLQHFWKRWSKECLQRYKSISKWKTAAQNIGIGTLVLLFEENLPPAQRSLARVTNLHPGDDNLVRVVDVKAATSTLTRPITKLIVLPVDSYRNDVAVGGEDVART